MKISIILLLIAIIAISIEKCTSKYLLVDIDDGKESDRGASCDCHYRKGGCKIGEAPPKGWMCKCRYLGFWTCDGYPKQWTSPEIQPGCDGCLRKECCFGDCGGYGR